MKINQMDSLQRSSADTERTTPINAYKYINPDFLQSVREMKLIEVDFHADSSHIAVAELRVWINQLREKFGLPPKVKGRDAWWDGYETAIQDLDSFISQQSENN